jgi:hypothetical protein
MILDEDTGTGPNASSQKRFPVSSVNSDEFA